MNDKITKAKVGVILEQPFFATLMLRKQFIADPNISKFSTNGEVIKYNPQYVEEIGYEELKTIICRAAMHTALLHHLRRNGRGQAKWNKACEYAVNPILQNAGMRLPPGSLISKEYDNITSEGIYKMMGEDPDEDGPPQSHDPDVNVEDGSHPTKSEQEQEAEVKQALAQAMLVSKQQGKMPAELERLIKELLNPIIPWEEVLARFLSEPAKNDYSFSKPNTRFLHTGFILPSLSNLEIAEVFLIVDVSGSVSEKLLNQFAGEMQSICSTYSCPITVLYVNTKVTGTERIEPDDVFKLSPKGGGGTDFRPGFEWLKERDIEPKSLVYLTDGECNSFPEEPDFHVLWAIYGNNTRFKPPFGEVIQVDYDE